MPVHNAFPTPIYYVKPKDEDEYDLIQEELMNVHENTEYQQPEFFPKSASHELTPNPFGSNVIKKYNCSNFLEFLKREVKDFMGSLDYTNPMEYLIDASWITKTTKGKFALEHTHGATDISGVYYIKTNEKDGNLFFKDPNERSVGNLLMDLTVQQNVAPLQQGLLILWPGYLSHGTFANETDHERLSLSFNIKFTRRGFTIKDNVENTRALVVRDDNWRDYVDHEDL
tara:strand:- start:2161 stop:2844 length:684 start_codon:yes stop_codon:yes gene_type:complete